MKEVNNREILIHNFEEGKKKRKKITLAAVLIIAAGIFSGFLLSKSESVPSFSPSSVSETHGKKIVVGSVDTKTFRDQAEGVLETGGIDGEGTHKLIREGGESQTVYLTSSVLDLSQFVGKKVRIWGETHAAQKAGWLMDVGKVETIE